MQSGRLSLAPWPSGPAEQQQDVEEDDNRQASDNSSTRFSNQSKLLEQAKKLRAEAESMERAGKEELKQQQHQQEKEEDDGRIIPPTSSSFLEAFASNRDLTKLKQQFDKNYNKKNNISEKIYVAEEKELLLDLKEILSSRSDSNSSSLPSLVVTIKTDDSLPSLTTTAPTTTTTTHLPIAPSPSPRRVRINYAEASEELLKEYGLAKMFIKMAVNNLVQSVEDPKLRQIYYYCLLKEILKVSGSDDVPLGKLGEKFSENGEGWLEVEKHVQEILAEEAAIEEEEEEEDDEEDRQLQHSVTHSIRSSDTIAKKEETVRSTLNVDLALENNVNLLNQLEAANKAAENGTPVVVNNVSLAALRDIVKLNTVFLESSQAMTEKGGNIEEALQAYLKVYNTSMNEKQNEINNSMEVLKKKDDNNKDAKVNNNDNKDKDAKQPFLLFDRSANTPDWVNVSSASEEFLRLAFPSESRQKGEEITRKGAGLLQAVLLKDLFTTYSVRRFDGAVIFNGEMNRGYTPETLQANITERLKQYNLTEALDFSILEDDVYPPSDSMDLETIMTYVVEDPTTAVVLYPASWTPRANMVYDQPNKMIRSFLTAFAFGTSVSFAISCSNIITPQGLRLDDLWTSFFPLLFGISGINFLTEIVELTVASMKSVKLDITRVPSLNLFNFGTRSVLTTLARDRKDIFDLAWFSWSTGTVTSFIAVLLGIYFTKTASPEMVQSFPTIPSSIFELNTIIRQLFNGLMPNVLAVSEAGKAETNVHLHWLAIVGMSGFISQVFQLLPLDSSAGSKMTLGALGAQLHRISRGLMNLTKIIFMVAVLLNIKAITSIPQTFDIEAVTIDFFLFSQLCGLELDLPVRNAMTPIGDLRMVAYFAAVSILVISFVPVDNINQHSLQSAYDSAASFFSSFQHYLP
eukprot:gene8175-9021_t